ncbi:hypothetical protein QJS10_CPA03g01232 [Acorus calamus]|uniref:Clp R domain-containing protein n=1 Tax=Acorus calamus TaxID=4465 RepID=A0AAV9F8U7_ACOCL|nr:hypothetical protein QJS10_CPA03g01232 [Acorus calamus]
MPTPVSVARQCLAADSVRALDDAVSAARRRSHSQTTSLHVVYPLLSSSSSSTLLRDALSRTPSPSYSPRLHLKALDLCFSVALDRLPSSSSSNSSSTATDDPSSSSPPPLVLSILDDPVISRVFSEAGFRSCDIKYAILRPPPPLPPPALLTLRSGAGGAAGGRIPPIFLCNLTDAAGALEADGNCRRIGEVLVGGRGPVLVGVCAADSARDFAGCVGRRRWDLLPPALAGVEFVDVSESEIGDGGDGGDARIEEAEGLLEGGAGPGVVVCVGDLKGFLHEGEAVAAAERVVAGVTGMLGRHRGRVWLMGHVASYETYMKFLSRFPSVNKDWDLQLLPITSLRPAAGGVYPRLHSLTESFAPFGGFSATAPEMNNPLIGTHHSVFRCFLCNEKYEQEAAALLKGCNSIANQNYMTYPSYLQVVEAVGTCNGLDVEKAVYSNPVVANMYSSTWTPPNLKGTSAPVDKQVTGSADMYDKFNSSDFKELCRSLMEKVGRQEEAICAISQTVVRCRTGKERRLGASMKGDVWLSFLGPDRVGKKKIAVALAELIFGSKENFICVDFSLQEGLACSNKIFDRQGMNGYDEKFRGKTVVDHIASEISRKPLSIVFLENVDKADLLVQNSLSQAIRTGKISDSHGREISVNNAMFIATAREIKSKASLPRNECVTFSEERILEAREWQMQILVGSSSEARSSGSNVKVTSATKPVFLNKRKLNRAYDHKEQCGSLETSKRAHKASNVCLDLNLPVEEMEMNDADFSNDDTDCSSDSSEAWLEEFFDLVDETVVFSRFNFDALANKLLMKISDCFRSAVGSQGMLEIDSKVMDHILAATWLSDDTGAPDNWVKQVLVRSFSEARQRYNISAHTVLKLVHREDTIMEEHALGIRLPARITLN